MSARKRAPKGYAYVVALQAPGRHAGAHGLIHAQEGETRYDVIDRILRITRESAGVGEDSVVTFLSLEPNDVMG